MKKLISSLLVFGVILPNVVSASVVDDLQDRASSLREALASLIDLFSINYPGETLGLVVPTSLTVSTSTSTTITTSTTLQPMIFSSVVLSTTTLKIGGSRVSYRATIFNPNAVRSKPFSGVAIQGWIEQGRGDSSSTVARVPAGGALVVCNGATSQIGLVYPGSCLTSFTFGASNSNLLIPGLARAVFELKVGGVVVGKKSIPIQLTPYSGNIFVQDPRFPGGFVVSPGQDSPLLASFVVNATTGVNLSAVTMRVAGSGNFLSNLYVSTLTPDGSIEGKFGARQVIVSPGASYIMTSPTVYLSKGSYLAVHGSIKPTASAGTHTNLITLAGCNAGCVPTAGQKVIVQKPIQSSSTIALPVVKSAALGTPTYASGQSGARLGSYIVYAPAAQGANLTSISVRVIGTPSVSNLKLMIGSTQFGVTQPVVLSNATYTYAGALNIPAGSSKIIDVYGDILSSSQSGLYPGLTQFVGCSGSSAVTFNSISCGSVIGQDVRIGGQATIQVSLDSASPAANQLVMGSTGNNLASFRFTETAGVEDVKITQLYILDRVSSTLLAKPSFSNLGLYSGATQLAVAGSPIPDGNAYGYTFNFSQPLIVPKTGSASLLLRGDVASYSSSGATDNSKHVFVIATSTNPNSNTAEKVVFALGRTSNSTSVVKLSSPVAYTQTVLRTKLGVSAAPIGTTSGRVRTVFDDLAKMIFTADAADNVVLDTVTITFSGGANSSTLPSTARLIDDTTGTVLGNATTTRTTANSVTFGNIGYIIPAGTSRAARVRINSINTTNLSQQADPLALTVNAQSDIQYTTGIFGGTSGISLPVTAIPLNLASVSYE